MTITLKLGCYWGCKTVANAFAWSAYLHLTAAAVALCIVAAVQAGTCGTRAAEGADSWAVSGQRRNEKLYRECLDQRGVWPLLIAGCALLGATQAVHLYFCVCARPRPNTLRGDRSAICCCNDRVAPLESLSSWPHQLPPTLVAVVGEPSATLGTPAAVDPRAPPGQPVLGLPAQAGDGHYYFARRPSLPAWERGASTSASARSLASGGSSGGGTAATPPPRRSQVAPEPAGLRRPGAGREGVEEEGDEVVGTAVEPASPTAGPDPEQAAAVWGLQRPGPVQPASLPGPGPAAAEWTRAQSPPQPAPSARELSAGAASPALAGEPSALPRPPSRQAQGAWAAAARPQSPPLADRQALLPEPLQPPRPPTAQRSVRLPAPPTAVLAAQPRGVTAEDPQPV
ncbi:hypothetical protein HYH03_006637 [Edaphochlamys debaryana]|uniref:Uncharacterized protein n=1 Tax=Edaphochlamys debaryana TaxID=47281 RepID=A0A836C1C1_9CHLO|nr:hypothetical protein HYH03_006637 [Edaphochlamys debaryana]|eukprot:KAG2495369.1 hypothetical protein HYH03_006637 [Edaphochlamys debaryana]